ncbi:hypothetical protein D9619_008840 [Psilocybe cf. subviscida]|uniref:F-box domain-containing protein n=1 Tax=Psilocybe cf. subviscida TaxID=2480587 RepID=A0A8H5BA04_9AGAR|nr:hypothetical protein D9619_008840 [Psilocybe cf. subviscida]
MDSVPDEECGPTTSFSTASWSAPSWATFSPSAKLPELPVTKWITPRRYSTLEKTPTEILVQVLSMMPWRDVLRARQTCKRVADVTTARSIWLHHYRLLCDSFTVLPALGKPIELCTSHDIETITLSWIKSRRNWCSQEGVPRVVELKIPYPGCQAALVPGSRWLLVYSLEGALEGSVFAYDLHAPMPQEPHRVIIPQDNIANQHFTSMMIDVDHDQPQLTFTVCLRQSTPGQDASLATIVFYRVTQVGHGPDAKLESTRINSLQLPETDYLYSKILRGRYYARLHERKSEGNLAERIEIYDWMASSSSEYTLAFVNIEAGQQHYRFDILSGEKLFIFWYDSFEVFHFSTMHKMKVGTNNNLNDQLSLKPYWVQDVPSLPLDGPVISAARFHSRSASTRLTYASKDGLYAITIPAGPQKPQHFRLWDIHVDFNYLTWLGMNSWYYISWEKELICRSSFLWPTDPIYDPDDEPVCGPGNMIELKSPCVLGPRISLDESTYMAAVVGTMNGNYTFLFF